MNIFTEPRVKKTLWGLVIVIDVAILLSVILANGEPVVDFIYYVTG